MEKTSIKIPALKKAIHQFLDSADSHVDYIDDIETDTEESGEWHKKVIRDYLKAAIGLLE